jgi:hypothetical protein
MISIDVVDASPYYMKRRIYAGSGRFKYIMKPHVFDDHTWIRRISVGCLGRHGRMINRFTTLALLQRDPPQIDRALFHP